MVKTLLALLTATMLAACGGGADEDDSASKNRPCTPVANQPSSCK